MLDNLPKRIRSEGVDLRLSKRLNISDHNISDQGDLSLKEVRKLLLREKVRTYDRRDIIPLHSLKEFWMSRCELNQFLESLYCSTSSAHAILKNSLRFFTALVLVNWDSNERFCRAFEAFFGDHENSVWTDESLTDIISPSSAYPSISMDEANCLDSTLNLVSVPVLSKESKPFHTYTPLPITSKTEIGKGSYGKVYKIRIAKGCLMVENASGSTSPNEAEHEFALKEMKDASESQGELRFLRQYLSRGSKHIMVHLAIIERGDEVSVIYPLAIGDLQKLFEGRLESRPWKEEDAGQFRDIVRKLCDLADGLDFLHSGMRSYSSLVCRHGDLKPNNFLIFDSGWKISDMGLAKVKNISDDESGVRKTTKTTSKDGCGPYAAPEMGGADEDPIGRETDIWSLAAITMELIIWGFGGPSAWDAFVHRRQECSKGLFYESNALSPIVDQELQSWPEVHREKISMFLDGDEKRAWRFLKDIVDALRKALEIDPNNRANSNDFLQSMEKAYKHFEKPVKAMKVLAATPKLELRAITAWGALKRKFEEHRNAEIFTKGSFEPREQIRVSNETVVDIESWIHQPTPSALCMLTGSKNEWLHVSAITHEVYYSARRKEYDVVEFLTLNRYDHTSTPLQAALDFIYCFIYQLLRDKTDNQLQECDLDRLTISDPTLSEKIKFESAVDVLGQIINLQQYSPRSKPRIVIMDEFWRVCTRATLDVTEQHWKKLLILLGCATARVSGILNAGSTSVAPDFRVLIRANGWFDDLEDLGFRGKMCRPSLAKHDGLILRETLNDVF